MSVERCRLALVTAARYLVPSPVPVAVRSSAPVRSGAPVPTGPSPVAVTTFGLRASAVAPQFVTGGIVTLTVASVILVAFAGGPTDRARQVVQTAVSILAVALGLGVVKSRLGRGHSSETARSARTPLKLPRCFYRVLDRAAIALGEVSDDHHVLEVPGRDAEGAGKLPQY